MEYTFHTGKNVITFTPEQSGTLPYTCWMGMIRGVITVEEPESPAEAQTAALGGQPAQTRPKM